MSVPRIKTLIAMDVLLIHISIHCDANSGITFLILHCCIPFISVVKGFSSLHLLEMLEIVLYLEQCFLIMLHDDEAYLL